MFLMTYGSLWTMILRVTFDGSGRESEIVLLISNYTDFFLQVMHSMVDYI
jgi:hypothetical protein